MTLEILSPWTGTGATTADAIRPAVGDAFALDSWTDATGQSAAAGKASARPSPNLAVIRCDASDKVAAAILADPVWGPRVLHDAVTKDAAPPAKEVGDLKTRLQADGMSSKDTGDVVDARPGATRKEIAESLTAWLKDRPRA